jgi:ribokinase
MSPAIGHSGDNAAMPVRVSVLGSLNTDISVAVPKLPGPGETVLGSAAVIGPGGKGANQAVAAARLGAQVRMAGCVGDDDFGRRLRAGLAAEGVDVSGVRVVAGSSGLALIAVDGTGENAITVAPGANASAGEPEVTAAVRAGCQVLVASAEVPLTTLATAFTRVRGTGVTTVLNLAPIPAGAAGLLAAGVDWLVVNAGEAAALLGRDLPQPGEPVAGQPGANVAGEMWEAAADLTAAGARHAVITLGAHGAIVAGRAVAARADGRPGWDGGPDLLPGFAVTAVDTVGAGDAFTGALAVALARGAEPVSAVYAACAAGAAAATRPGTWPALPTLADVRAVTGQQDWPQFPGRADDR